MKPISSLRARSTKEENAFIAPTTIVEPETPRAWLFPINIGINAAPAKFIVSKRNADAYRCLFFENDFRYLRSMHRGTYPGDGFKTLPKRLDFVRSGRFQADRNIAEVD